MADARYPAAANLDVGALSTSTWTLALSSAVPLRQFEIFNTDTTSAIEVSLDGGTTLHATIPPAAGISRDLVSNDLVEASDVYVRKSATTAVSRVFANGSC